MPVIIAASILGMIAYFTGHTEISSLFNLNYIAGTGEITVYLMGITGAGLGFLWFNFFPAQIFMGDTGSLMLGGLLGLVAIFLKQEILFVLIGLVFVIEAVSVILQVGSYKMRQKRIFKMAPIHHHFELQGLAETKVTVRFWIIALLCGIASLIVLKLR
jgi:phospho-N-acetylmuramoyl-pentapeptide-transferase